MPTDRDYAECMELVEAVMEWIGMRWTKSMIKRELREYFGQDLSFMTCNFLIKAACLEIRKRYNINPQYYKGKQIEFYESIIRNRHEKTKDRLTAAERLDKLFGLENVSTEDPDVVASKIREALKEMDESVGGQDEQGQSKDSGDAGEGKDDVGDKSNAVQQINGRTSDDTNNERQTRRNDKNTKTVDEDDYSTEVDDFPKEIINEIDNLDKNDFKRFRKEK